MAYHGYIPSIKQFLSNIANPKVLEIGLCDGITTIPISVFMARVHKDFEFVGIDILIKESLIPFNAKNPERDLKIAGDTGIVCRLEGLPIYRKTYYSTKANVDDIFVQHDNKEEIKSAFNGSMKSNSDALQKAAAEDFDI